MKRILIGFGVLLLVGAGNTPQPVMVWLHGGSHQFGSGSSDIYQANGLVENGVVLVTVNYRLGPFGCLAHPALTAASPNASSGNYGLADGGRPLPQSDHGKRVEQL